MRLSELTADQMSELKQRYFGERYGAPTPYIIETIDFWVSDKEICKEYGDTEFSPDDFFCSTAD